MEYAGGRSRGSESEGRHCEPSPRRRVVVYLHNADKSHRLEDVSAKRPTLRRGRPSMPAAKQAARTKKRRFVHGGCMTLRYECPAPASALRSLCGKISLAPWRQRPVPGTRGVLG